MVESVASSTTFDLPVDELITQAAESLGGDHLTANELKRARTALNLILINIQNRGIAPLASISHVSVALVSGSSLSYPLGTSAFNVKDIVIRTSTASGAYTDFGTEMIGFSDWLNISKKTTEGRPTQVLVNRQRTGPVLNVWPVPDSGAYSIQAWVVKRAADVTAAYQLVDVPHRYLGVLVNGLKFHIAQFRKADINTLQWLKMQYEEELLLALDEDRERIDLMIYPDTRSPI